MFTTVRLDKEFISTHSELFHVLTYTFLMSFCPFGGLALPCMRRVLVTQAWLTCRPTRDSCVQSFVRCRRARVLMLRYLGSTGDRPVTVFPPALRYSLQRHLAIGKGDNLLRQAQDIAIQVCLSVSVCLSTVTFECLDLQTSFLVCR